MASGRDGESVNPESRSGARKRFDPLEVLLVALPAVLVAVGLDAYTCHVRDDYFTGGFLHSIYCSGPWDVFLFFGSSLLLDLTFYGALALVVLSIRRWFRLDRSRWVRTSWIATGL